MARSKPTSKRAERRREPRRKQNQRVLIVCEGENTEFYYFKSFKNALRLANLEIKLHPMGKKSAPIRAIKVAKKLIQTEEYDIAYCVFDRDRHDTFEEACKQENKQLKVIKSIPCFEIWVLLHYEYTNRCFSVSGQGSVSEPIIQCIKKHLKDYDKSQEKAKTLYDDLAGQIDQAIKNSRRLRSYQQLQQTQDPYTDVDLLVEKLHAIKRQTTDA